MRALALLLLAGCGGAPFTVATIDGGSSVALRDELADGAGSQELDASADAPGDTANPVELDATKPVKGWADVEDVATADASRLPDQSHDAGTSEDAPDVDPGPQDATPWDALPICLPHEVPGNPPTCRGY